MDLYLLKYQVLHVTRLKNPIPSKCTLHNTVLESVSSVKYLGVIVTDCLSWGSHISNITTKANQILGFVRRNMKVYNKDFKATTYKTLIRPQLEYASSECSPHTATDITKVESVQIARLILLLHSQCHLSVTGPKIATFRATSN